MNILEFNPYITFNGNCQEALSFYKECFKGEIVFIQYYRESPQDVPDDYKNQIMHSEFKAGKIKFMACDNMPGQTLSYGTNITFNIAFDSENEQQEVFNSLAKEGKVYLPLQETFWKSRFGLLTDKFGIHWMLNCDIKT